MTTETALGISTVLLWLVTLLNFLLIAAINKRIYGYSEPSMATEGLPPGKEMPSFKASTLGGEAIRSKDLIGKQWMLVFVSVKCRPCLDRLSELVELKEDLGGKGIEVLLISENTAFETKELFNRTEIPFMVAVAPKQENPLFDDFGVSVTPFFYLVGEKGVIKAGGVFGPEWRRVRAELLGVGNNKPNFLDGARKLEMHSPDHQTT